MSIIGCTNDAIISTRCTVHYQIIDFLKTDTPIPNRVVINKDNFCTTILCNLTTGIRCTVTYPEDSYWLRLLNTEPTKDICLCKIVKGLSSDDLSKLGNTYKICFTVNGQETFDPRTGVRYDADASNIQEKVLDWIEYSQCKLLKDEWMKDDMWFIYDKYSVRPTRYDICEKENIPISDRITYQVLDYDYGRGHLFKSHICAGKPIDQTEIESKKVRLYLNTIKLVRDRCNDILHVDVTAVVE